MAAPMARSRCLSRAGRLARPRDLDHHLARLPVHRQRCDPPSAGAELPVDRVGEPERAVDQPHAIAAEGVGVDLMERLERCVGGDAAVTDRLGPERAGAGVRGMGAMV